VLFDWQQSAPGRRPFALSAWRFSSRQFASEPPTTPAAKTIKVSASISRKQQAERRDTVTKERFLTVRWNNILTLGLGLPALAYAVVALSTGIASNWAGFLGLVVIGVLY